MLNPTRTDVLRDVEKFLSETRISEAAFGRAMIGDPRLVQRLRDGRDLLTGTMDKINAYMALTRAEHAARETGA